MSSIVVSPQAVPIENARLQAGENPQGVSVLLAEWLDDPSDYDSKVWPILEGELRQDRPEFERDDKIGP